MAALLQLGICYASSDSDDEIVYNTKTFFGESSGLNSQSKEDNIEVNGNDQSFEGNEPTEQVIMITITPKIYKQL